MRTLASKDVVALLREIAAETRSIAPKARQCPNGVVEYWILRSIRGDDQAWIGSTVSRTPAARASFSTVS